MEPGKLGKGLDSLYDSKAMDTLDNNTRCYILFYLLHQDWRQLLQTQSHPPCLAGPHIALTVPVHTTVANSKSSKSLDWTFQSLYSLTVFWVLSKGAAESSGVVGSPATVQEMSEDPAPAKLISNIILLVLVMTKYLSWLKQDWPQYQEANVQEEWSEESQWWCGRSSGDTGASLAVSASHSHTSCTVSAPPSHTGQNIQTIRTTWSCWEGDMGSHYMLSPFLLWWDYHQVSLQEYNHFLLPAGLDWCRTCTWSPRLHHRWPGCAWLWGPHSRTWQWTMGTRHHPPQSWSPPWPSTWSWSPLMWQVSSSWSPSSLSSL